MAREPSQKLVDYGIIAGVLLAGYVVWTMFFKKEAPKECPAGQKAVNPCEGQIGWPAFLCNLGRNVTGAFLDCKPDITPGGDGCPAGSILENGMCKPVNIPAVPTLYDQFGCVMQLQKWCPIDKKCMDNTRSCTPDPALIPSPGACYEWSPTFHQWLYSPSMPGCESMITCPDGSMHYPGNCPTVIPKCAESECTPGATLCADGISKICVPLGIGCEERGFWANTTIDFCKAATNIVDCACGKVDISIAGSCAKACAGYVPPNYTTATYFQCLKEHPTPVPSGFMCGQITPEGCKAQYGSDVEMVNGCCESATLHRQKAEMKVCLATPRPPDPTLGWENWISSCRGAGHSVTTSIPTNIIPGSPIEGQGWGEGWKYYSQHRKPPGGEYPGAELLACVGR
jgi:hypothetical protein